MKKHTETLIKIREYQKELADRLISAWGTDKFYMIIDEIMSKHSEFATSIAKSIDLLKEEHLIHFPKIVPFSIDELPEELAELSASPDFRYIHEHYPHISKRLAINWGAKQGLEYLESLFVDDRAGQRRGFPEEAYKRLIKLLELHNLIFADLKAASTDPWELL